jgi:hypothetical protein
VLGQHRSTQRYERRVAADEPALVGRIEQVVRSHPRYGYRMVCGRLRLEGWLVNHKRVHRLCRREGLRGQAHSASGSAITRGVPDRRSRKQSALWR